jgi:hypothetical protein
MKSTSGMRHNLLSSETESGKLPTVLFAGFGSEDILKARRGGSK